MAYIGVQPADAYTSFAVQHFTTSATTSYTLDNPVANENEIALFINNVRQEPGSSYAYTASGTALTLSAATSASDTMYCVFIGKAVQTVTPANGSVTNDMISYPLAKSGATVSTFNRTTSDGDIVELQKDGTTIGSIGVNASDNIYLSGNSTHAGIQFGSTSAIAFQNGSIVNNTIDLGASTHTWKDLYLGGSVYLGGTGSANALGDFEEGTFTPQYRGSVGSAGSLAYSSQEGRYTKIGRLVFIQIRLILSNNGSFLSGGDIEIYGLPFSIANQAAPAPASLELRKVSISDHTAYASFNDNSTFLKIKVMSSTNNPDSVSHGSTVSDSGFLISGMYIT